MKNHYEDVHPEMVDIPILVSDEEKTGLENLNC